MARGEWQAVLPLHARNLPPTVSSRRGPTCHIEHRKVSRLARQRETCAETAYSFVWEKERKKQSVDISASSRKENRTRLSSRPGFCLVVARVADMAFPPRKPGFPPHFSPPSLPSPQLPSHHSPRSTYRRFDIAVTVQRLAVGASYSSHCYCRPVAITALVECVGIGPVAR